MRFRFSYIAADFLNWKEGMSRIPQQCQVGYHCAFERYNLGDAFLETLVFSRHRHLSISMSIKILISFKPHRRQLSFDPICTSSRTTWQ